MTYFPFVSLSVFPLFFFSFSCAFLACSELFWMLKTGHQKISPLSLPLSPTHKHSLACSFWHAAVSLPLFFRSRHPRTPRWMKLTGGCRQTQYVYLFICFFEFLFNVSKVFKTASRYQIFVLYLQPPDSAVSDGVTSDGMARYLSSSHSRF